MLIHAIDRLLALAHQLRRNNASKWESSINEWQAAVADVLSAMDHDPIVDPLAEGSRAVRSHVRRLANSGEARLHSAMVGRLPDSSLAGRRFDDDLETFQRLSEFLR